jgi:RNA polymerase-binding transcription factor DksA
MDDGTYGRCVHCSTSIPLPRLELVPHADGCVDCRRSRGSGR